MYCTCLGKQVKGDKQQLKGDMKHLTTARLLATGDFGKMNNDKVICGK